MRSILYKIFINNWARKLISLLFAMLIWIVVNHSISSTKTVHNVPVKVTNLPSGKTVEGLKPNNLLNKGVTLSLTGNKHVLDAISAEDLLVIIDADRKKGDWIAKVTPKNLLCLNPSIDITSNISYITHSNIIIKPTNLIREKIQITITRPIGEAPKGFQFIDVYPYKLYTHVTGPENVVKSLKTKNLKLTFNLNQISKELLEELNEKRSGDTISYFIPEEWKTLNLPYISSDPIKIEDVNAKDLRMDFAKTDMIPLESKLPITLYFPPQYRDTLNPDTYSLSSNEFIKEQNGMHFLNCKLFATGVSPLFLEIVKDMIQVVVIATPFSEGKNNLWNVQFIYPVELENRYVAQSIKLANSDPSDVRPNIQEEYLRNRFRYYMNRFRLYTENSEKLYLDIKIQADKVNVKPKNL